MSLHLCNSSPSAPIQCWNSSEVADTKRQLYVAWENGWRRFFAALRAQKKPKMHILTVFEAYWNSRSGLSSLTAFNPHTNSTYWSLYSQFSRLITRGLGGQNTVICIKLSASSSFLYTSGFAHCSVMRERSILLKELVERIW